MAEKNNACIPNIAPLIAAGINPKTGLPYKFDSTSAIGLKDDMFKFISLQDEQDALNRFTWNNLPEGLDSNLLERILYFRGQGAFFYIKTNDKFYFLPYALSGTIDVYGRYMGITPVPFGGGSTDNEGKQKPWITGLIRKPEYQISKEEDESKRNESCVLLHDYSKGISEIIIPRANIQKPIINIMAETIPFMRTNMINNTGISGMRISDQSEESNVRVASRSVYDAALNGDKWVPMVGDVNTENFDGSNAGQKAQEYLLAYQSLDNMRMCGYGLGGGVYNKAEHMLQSEDDRNSVNSSLILADALYQRKQFCDVVNSIWGLNISCEVSEETEESSEPEEEKKYEETNGEENLNEGEESNE